MPAYWIARAKINDPVEYKHYTDLVPAIIAKYGGKVLARGGKYEIMEGPEHFHRFVVIEFPSLADGTACFKSEEYQTAAHTVEPMALAKCRLSLWKAATRLFEEAGMKVDRVIMAQQGAPDVMQFESVELPSPGEGEVQIRQSAIG